jgi:hypothetical protein
MNNSTNYLSLLHSERLFKATYRRLFLVVSLIFCTSAISANYQFNLDFLINASQNRLQFTSPNSAQLSTPFQAPALITESEEVNEHEVQHREQTIFFDICLFCLESSKSTFFLSGLTKSPKTETTPLYILFHSWKIYQS